MADIDKINEQISNRKFEEALNFTKEALKEEPENIELIKLAGLSEVNLEIWHEAKVHFETVVKFNPEDATSWFYLANCYNNLADFISAKNAYLKVIELREEYVEAYKSLCVVLLKLELMDETVEYAKKAQKYAPDDYLFDFVIGTAYLKLKEFEKSIEPFETALKKDSENIATYNSLGTAYMASQRTEDAINCYKKVIERFPENPMGYFNLGSAYQIQQKHQR